MSMNLSMYSPLEQVILADYFGFPAPEYDDSLNFYEADPQYPSAIILEPDMWGDLESIRAVPNAVARIALARVQTSLPQFAVCGPDGIAYGRELMAAPSRSVELISHHLFTIDWAMSAPGLSWPEAYYLTWMPGVEQWLVTASRDTPEVGGYCDLAIGYFGPDKAPEEGAEMVIGDYWSDQYLDYDQSRWEVFFDAGMISREGANAWADDVWSLTEEEETGDSPATSGAI